MNSQKFAAAKASSSVWVAEPLATEVTSDEIDSLPAKLGLGQAFLKVVAYPWGVEFEVCNAGMEE